MMSITHAALGVAGASLIMGTVDPAILALAVVGSQLPDLDSTESLIGRAAYPLARWIEDRYPHRSITHSLLVNFGLIAATLPLVFLKDWKWWLAIPIGHLVSIFSDTFTKQGVQLFYPSPVWAVFGRNPNRRLTTGSVAEYWVLAMAIALIVLSINLQTSGGIIAQANQLLGTREGIEQAYNRHGGDSVVFVNVKGVWGSDRRAVEQRFWILAQRGKNFLLADNQGIYLTSEQIIPERLSVEVGDKVSIQIQPITLVMQDITPLEAIQIGHQNSGIYVSGTLTIDAPELITVPFAPDSFQTVTITSTTATFDHCPLQTVLALMREQFVSGSLSVKIIFPEPKP